MLSSDKKMLELLDLLKDMGIIKFDTEFCEAAGLKKQNLRNIKNNVNHFTPDHIANICKEFKVNANWIFNLSNKVFTTKKMNDLIINKQ